MFIAQGLLRYLCGHQLVACIAHLFSVRIIEFRKNSDRMKKREGWRTSENESSRRLKGVEGTENEKQGEKYGKNRE